MAPTDISSVLSQVNYRHPDLTKRQVATLLHHYKGLSPKKDRFTFNDGQDRELVNIQGTIPVPYRGQNYNIPVSLYLLDTHPYHAPLCYVKPTSDMQVKVSKHVDAAGKIYLPYLHEWAHPASDLVGLVQICIVTFSEQPPVYAKPRQPALPYPAQPPGQSYPGAYPPYPPQAGPYPPAYPPGGPGYPPAYPAQGQGGPPAYPPYPPQGPGGPGAYPPYPPQAGGFPQPQPAVRQDSMTGTVTAEHLTASIRSAVEDKVRRGLREQVEEKAAEMQVLRNTGQELEQGKAKLVALVERLGREEEQVERDSSILQQKREELEALVAKTETTEPIQPDEAVEAGTPLYRQLVSAYAEESAAEDVIYMLGRALGEGVLECEAYLKQVRSISRKQFLLRETMGQCRRKAGLPL